jgi:hypothetical protein
MLLENSYGENCAGCCPECTQSTASHCQHCPLSEKGFAVQLPNGCGCGHLVGSAPIKRDLRFDVAEFDGVLTDYDRMLLHFGMHILWYSSSSEVAEDGLHHAGNR